LRLVLEEKNDFFIEKINYTKKLIDTLVIHSKDVSQKISAYATHVKILMKNIDDNKFHF
jgi:hypothetical protein